MATLVNKKNRQVKVIIPNMREFSTFYSDNEGVIPMFFKRDWVAVKEEHWKPSEEQMQYLLAVINDPNNAGAESCHLILKSLYNDLKKLI